MAVVTDGVHCPHADACGSCAYIHFSYPDQLARKTARVTAAVRRFESLAGVPVAPCVPAGTLTAYRTRSKLVVGQGAVGLYRPGTHILVDIPECKVIPESIARAIARVRSAVVRGEVPVHTELPGRPPTAGLRAVDVRGTSESNDVLLTLVVDPGAASAVEALGRSLLREFGKTSGIFVSVHAHGQPRLLGGEPTHLIGQTRLVDTLGSTRYVVSPGAFVQSHRSQAATVHSMVLQSLACTTARVLDVYGGAGGIGVALAARGARVTLVESYAPAVADAVESARRNGVAIDVVASDAGAALAALVARRERFDLVVINPPRRGCDMAVRRALAKLDPQRMVYVSCDPETLARDLDHLHVLGYTTEEITPLDMIPLTAEVECVARLVRGAVPAPRVLWMGGGALVLDKPGGEPCDPRPELPGSLRARVQHMAEWRDVRTVLSPDEGASGICVLVRPGDQRPWEASVRAPSTKSVWTTLVRGVTPTRATVRKALPGIGASELAYVRNEIVGGQALLEVTAQGCNAGTVRRLLASAGHPVVGDSRYGHAPTNRHLAEQYTLTRTFLHLARVELTDPRESLRLTFIAELPADLGLVMDRLRSTSRSRPTVAG